MILEYTDDAVRYAFGYAGMQGTVGKIRAFGGVVNITSGKGKGGNLHVFVNERMIIIQKGKAIVGCSYCEIRRRPWLALAALDRQHRQ